MREGRPRHQRHHLRVLLGEYRATGAELESRYGGSDFEAFAMLLLLNCRVVDAPERLDPPVSVDPDDDKFLACAAAGGALVIVSGDSDLLAVDGWRGIQVLRPRTFVERYLDDTGGGTT